MVRKFFLSVFRFNAKTDYLPYYKKHTISLDTDKTVAELLECVKDDDPLFEYPTGKNIALKINKQTLFIDTKLSDIYENFGNELTIESLKEKRSVKDLIIDTDDFYKSFDKLSAFVEHVDKTIYERYIHLHYASEALEYNEEYLGDGLLVFAYDMIKKYPNEKVNILKAIADENNGIWYHTPLFHNVFENASEYEYKINELKKELLEQKPPISEIVEKELARISH